MPQVECCLGWRKKVAPLEPDEVEMLLGFPRDHTRGLSRTDRYKSLGNSFQANLVIIVGTLQGSRLAREVVEDCIVRNVPPAPKIRNLMTSLASQEFETLRL